MIEHRARSLGILAEAAYLAFLPVALFLAYRVSPINQLGLVDPWMYTGFVHNFTDLVDRYGLTYYAVRFGLILPHLVLAKALGPVAGYLAFCYVLYLLAGVPLYLLFRKHYSVEAGIFAYALLVSSVWLARTILWTHPDAAAVPYMLAAISLLLLDPARRAPAFFAIGFLFSLAANSNIFSITISGLSGAAYLILHAGNLRKRIAKDAAWMAAGFLTVFALGWIGYLACTGTPDFLRPTRHMIRWGFSGAGEVFRVPYSQIFRTVDYVYLPIVLGAALVLSAVVVRKQDRIFAAAAGYFVAVVAFVSWWQFASRGVVLELFYYFSFLIPPLLICAALVAVRLNLARGNVSGKRWLLLSTLAVVSLPLLHVYGFLDFSAIARQPYLAINGIVLGTIAAGRWVTIAAPLGALLFSTAMHAHWNVRDSARPGISVSPYYGVWGTTRGAGLDAFRLAIKIADSMPKIREDGRPVLFWYSQLDPLINSLQSIYLWKYSRLHSTERSAPGLPQLSTEDVHKLIASGQSWLVLIDHAEDAIGKGLKALREQGFILKGTRHSRLCSGILCIEFNISKIDGMGAAQPFSDAEGASLGRAAQPLLVMQAATLVPQLQPKIYGKLRKLQNLLSKKLPNLVSQFKLAELMPEGYVLFRSTSAADYLATQFLDPVGASMGGSRDFRLRIEHDSKYVPSSGCRIELQDQDFHALTEFACSEPDEQGHTRTEKVFRLAGIPERIRMVIRTRQSGESALPVRIELAQAVSKER